MQKSPSVIQCLKSTLEMKFLRKSLVPTEVTVLNVLRRSSSKDIKINLPFFTQNHPEVSHNATTNNNKNDNSNTDSYLYFENEAIQYWKVFFDVAFYTLVCPFRFVWNPTEGIYNCYSNRLQRALHYTLFAVMTSCYLLRLKKMSTLNKNPEQNPTEFFDVAVYFFDSTFMILLFLYFGRKKRFVYQVFMDLQSQNNKYYSSAVNYKKTRRQGTFLLIGCFTTVWIKFMEMVWDEHWSFEAVLRFKKKESEELFINKSLTNSVPWLFVFLNISSTLFEKHLNDLGDILFTMTVLLFRSLVNSFKNEMDSMAYSCGRPFRDSSPALGTLQILGHYNWLKEITTKINSATGIITGAFIAGNLPFFATHFLSVFGDETGNVFVRMRYIFVFCYFFPSMFIAAVSHKKVESIKEWICKEENYSRIAPMKLSVFLHELTFNSIGLSPFGILTITWNSVGSIISIIVTYALLKTQFKLEAADIPGITNGSGIWIPVGLNTSSN